MQRNLEKLLTARDVAELTQLDVKTIYMYVQKGLIPYVRIQSSIRFYESEIRAWIEEQAYRPQSSMT